MFKTKTWFRASPQLKGQVSLQLRCVFFCADWTSSSSAVGCSRKTIGACLNRNGVVGREKGIVNGVSETLNHIGAQWTELPPDFVRLILGCECLAFHLHELRWASEKWLKRRDSKSPDVGPWRQQHPYNNQEAFLVDPDTGNKASIRPDWLRINCDFIPIISPHETHLIKLQTSLILSTLGARGEIPPQYARSLASWSGRWIGWNAPCGCFGRWSERFQAGFQPEGGWNDSSSTVKIGKVGMIYISMSVRAS